MGFLDETGLARFLDNLKSYIASLGHASDSAVVHKTGAETVAGTKTFTDNLTMQKYAPYADFKQTAYAKGTPPTGTNKYSGLYLRDANGKELCHFMERVRATSGLNEAIIRLHNFTDSNTDSIVDIIFEIAMDGTTLLTIPCDTIPSTDNSFSLGSASKRWETVFAGTGTIDTSDERLKSSIEPVPDEVLDAWGDVGWVQFQFKDAVESKGASARLHSGMIAQRIDAAFRSHGLDASRFGLFCHDEWADRFETDDSGESVKVQEAGDSYSLRYTEALAMEAAYQRRRADRLEARIAALEARLDG